MLDLFAGRLGWSKAFLARGWEVTAVDLLEPPEIPAGVEFIQADVMTITAEFVRQFDFGCASSPCENFSLWGMRHFHPNPPFPELGLKLFNHTQSIFEGAGIPYVMENVRSARLFVGPSVHHCGPFHLWGTAVPPLMPQGIIKGMTREAMGFRQFKGSPVWNRKHALISSGSKSKQRKEMTAQNATIPPELANCVADYLEALLREGACLK
jgi:hypothetical protein